DGSSLSQVRILLDNASTASQAVGPPNNNVEMSWNGRSFPLLGRKMLSLAPMALQKVHPDDSVLGVLRGSAPASKRGLKAGVTYAGLIRSAFNNKWCGFPSATQDCFTHMEANFSQY